MTKHKVTFEDDCLTGAVISSTYIGDDWIDLEGITSFTEDIQSHAHYSAHEIPPECLSLKLLEYYGSQVRNGGHGQFVSNSGDKLAANVGSALEGLKLIGAELHYDNLSQLVSLPSDFDTSRSDGELPDLSRLDERFFQIERQNTIEDFCSRWLRGWSRIEVVEEKKYRNRIQELGMLHPLFERRSIWHSVEKLQKQIDDPKEFSAAVACGAVKPEPVIRRATIHAGTYLMQDGKFITMGCQKVVKWHFQSSEVGGISTAFLDKAGCRLYRDSFSQSPDDFGAERSSVSTDQIMRFADIAKSVNLAAGIDLSIRRLKLLGQLGDPALTAWKVNDSEATWIVQFYFNNDPPLFVITTEECTSILHDGRELLRVSKAEIAAHYADAIEGFVSLQKKH